MFISCILKKHKKWRDGLTDPYINTGLILGSSATIERMFSIARSICLEDRQSETPFLLDSLVFLKVNRKYWDLQIVMKAMNNLKQSNECSGSTTLQCIA